MPRMKSQVEATTDSSASVAAAMIDMALRSRDPLRRAQFLADAQRHLGVGLRSAVTECDKANVSWAEIGRAIGLSRETTYRQYESNGPIAVIRGTHKQEETNVNAIEAVYALETEGGTWFGPHDALAPDQYTSAMLPFQPADAASSRFAGQMLRVRFGPRPADQVSVQATRVRLADGSERAMRFTDEMIGLLFDPTGQNFLRMAMTNAFYAIWCNPAVDPQLQRDVRAAADAMKLDVPVDTFADAVTDVLVAADAPTARVDQHAEGALRDLRRAKRDFDNWRQAA